MGPFDKLYSCLKKTWVIVFCLFLVIISFYFWDKPIATYFYQSGIREHFPFLKAITALGKWYLYLVLFGVAALLSRYLLNNAELEQKAWFMTACVALANALNTVIKISLGRARPELLFAHQEYGFYWFRFNDAYWSFPSGHAVTITAVAAGLAVLAPRYFLIYLIALISITATRVLLYYHYLSDVLTGCYLAVIVVGLLLGYCKKNKWLCWRTQ